MSNILERLCPKEGDDYRAAFSRARKASQAFRAGAIEPETVVARIADQVRTFDRLERAVLEKLDEEPHRQLVKSLRRELESLERLWPDIVGLAQMRRSRR